MYHSAAATKNLFLYRTLFLFSVVIVLSLIFVAHSSSGQDSEKQKITYLLNAVEKSHGVFYRGGKQYTSKEARAHLQEKLDHAGGKIHTAEDFITYIGSKSSITGKPYYIKVPGDKKVQTGKWLHEKLAKMKTGKSE